MLGKDKIVDFNAGKHTWNKGFQLKAFQISRPLLCKKYSTSVKKSYRKNPLWWDELCNAMEK